LICQPDLDADALCTDRALDILTGGGITASAPMLSAATAAALVGNDPSALADHM
jgi:hypothetical protein